MDLELSEELVEVQQLARAFSEKEIAPAAAKDDREHVFRKDLVSKMGELGFYGCLIPEQYGGNGLGFLAHTLISEEIARVHSAIRVYLNMQAGPAVTLFEFGNEEQKKKYLPGLLSGQSIGLFAITETRCRLGRGGDENHRQPRRQELSAQWHKNLDHQRYGGGRGHHLRVHRPVAKIITAFRRSIPNSISRD